MPLHTQDLTVVIGGAGKTGRRVAQRLRAQGVPTRPASRSTTPRLDWDRPETWAPALDGAAAAYLSFHPDLAVPGAAETVGALAGTAVACGVRRLVLLSGRGEPEAQRAEEAVRRSGADWTIVRCSFFDQNFSESFWLDDVLRGTVALPVGDVREPFVDADDIADVAVAALTDGRHAGQLYELTGPELLSFEDAVGEIAAATGRDVRFEAVALADHLAAARRQGVPADVVALLEDLFSTVLDGRNASLGDGVQRALGRAPRDFGTYARAAAASGVWLAPVTAAGPRSGRDPR